MLFVIERSTFALAHLALLACSPEQAAVEESPEEEMLSPGCEPGEGVSGAPQSVEEVVRLVNSLPRPVTLECFMESLERPLRMEAAVSSLSAQLSTGARSPRFFLFSGPLIMTLVPEGTGRPLLELGQLVDRTRSLKAEIVFPVEVELTEEMPFETALFDDGAFTGCAFCHADESEVPGAPGRFISLALRPATGALVPLEHLQEELTICDHEEEPGRCAFFEALLGRGPVTHQAFPEHFETFGN